jgi:monofunctional biosynthetic peptidoglycan transglycosylase
LWRGLLWTALLLILLSVILVGVMRWVDPPRSMVMLQRQWEARLDGTDLLLKHRWCTAAELGTQLPRAVIAAEDQRFVDHHGFDLVELKKAVEQASEGGRLRGASTISQQVAKNLFLTTQRSWLRKPPEAWFTVLQELLWNKQRILEVHLNIVEWGPGIFGACAASEHYFGRSPAQLSAQQAALLAATLPAPLQRSPAAPGDYTRQRAAWIVDQMGRVEVP